MIGLYRAFIKHFSCFPRIYNLTALCTIFFAVPFYIFMLFVLYKSRKIQPFDSVFYRLIFILGVIDLLSIGHMYFFLKLPNTGNLYLFYKAVFDLSDEKVKRIPGSLVEQTVAEKLACHQSFQ